MKDNNNQLLINYDDACIYESDVALIRDPCGWLNSSCIHFFMNLMQSKSKQRRTNNNAADLFMDPSVLSFFVHFCNDRDEIEDFVSCHELINYKRVFFPVNNSFSSNDVTNTGSHWSLLVMILNRPAHQINCIFLHFDSADGLNYSAAYLLATKLDKAFNTMDKHYTRNSFENEAITECKTPQQMNANDCGTYMLFFIDSIGKIKNLGIKSVESSRKAYEQGIQPINSAEFRKQLIDEIILHIKMKDDMLRS